MSTNTSNDDDETEIQQIIDFTNNAARKRNAALLTKAEENTLRENYFRLKSSTMEEPRAADQVARQVTISSTTYSEEGKTNVVDLRITRDQATFLLNLVDRRLKECLDSIGRGDHLGMSVEESNQFYEDKNMCYALALLLNI